MALLIIILPIKTYANECDFLSDWISSIQYSPIGKSISEISKAQVNEFNRREKAARDSYNQYRAGNFSEQTLELCIPNSEDRMMFKQSMDRAFFRASVNELRMVHTPSLNRLVNLLDQNFSENTLPVFKLTGHILGNAPTNLKAGFHRAEHSIFMDLSRIPPNEWTIIFAHELLHGLDKQLLMDIRNYGSDLNTEKINIWSSAGANLQELSPALRSSLFNWVEAGMGRGLIGEYRTWLPTIQIYLEGLAVNAWSHISWLDSVLLEQQSDESLPCFVFRALDRRSLDPNEGLFTLPIFQAAIQAVRQRYRSCFELPLLGSLQTILGPE